MKKNLKKIGVLALVLTLFVALSACSFGNKDSKTADSKNTAQQVKQNAEKQTAKQKQAAKITTDEDKTAQLKKEKAISNGQVYVQNNKAIATMVIKSSISDKEVKDLAQKYAKDLKEKYKNMPVTVMAVRDNKNVANVTLK